MKNNGPLIHFWCMPFERRHVYLKHEAVITHSHRNLAMTMCLKDRLELAYSKEFYSGPGADVLLGSTKSDNVQNDVVKLLPSLRGQSFQARSLQFVEILGKKFASDTCFLLGLDENGRPLIGKLVEIFEINENIYFLSSKLPIICFDEYYHAFLVQKNTNPDILKNVEIIPKMCPFTYVEKDQKCYVAARYDI